MTGPRTLPRRISLQDLAMEVFFTVTRLRNTTETETLTPAAEKVLAEVRAVRAVEEKLTEDIVTAEARVAVCNLQLDPLVYDLRAVIARLVSGVTTAPLWERYFKTETPSRTAARALRTELPIVAPWVSSLKAEAEADLRSLGAKFELAVTRGKEALDKEDEAHQAYLVFETGAELQIKEAVQSWRQELYVDLHRIGKGERDWALSFFRPGKSPSRDVVRMLTVPEAQTELAEAHKAVADAQKELAAAQAREAAAQAKRAQDEADRKDLDETNQKIAELTAHAAELHKRLDP